MGKTPHQTPHMPSRSGPIEAAESPARSVLPSGWPELDAVLASGGWPVGELAELLGQGRSSLALAAVRGCQAAGQPVAWVDGPGHFCPATADVDLAALILVSPGAPRQPSRTLLAADLLLRSGAFGLLVLDLPAGRLPLAACFRLARQTGRARTTLLVLTGERRPLAGSAAALTLRVRFVHADWQPWEVPVAPDLDVSVRRQRGASGSARVRLGTTE
jgi:recombination protein RecA